LARVAVLRKSFVEHIADKRSYSVTG